MVHVVQRGETLFQIAKYYDVPVGGLIQSNPGLSSCGLMIGSQLLIPEKPGRSSVDAMQDQTECRDGKFFQVQKENLVRLMEISGLSYAALVCANPGIDFSAPLDGKLICLPSKDKFSTPGTEDIYVVRTGDNIDIISRRVGLPVNDLIRLNPSLTIPDYTKRGTPIGIPVGLEQV